MKGAMVAVCGCGRLLYEYLNDSGERIGVTHTPEDDEWHLEYWKTFPSDQATAALREGGAV